MIEYYGMDGEPISQMGWIAMMENPDSRIVKQTTLDDGTFVSTVLLGLDHNFGHGPPIIFETMIFDSKASMDERWCDRYSNKDAALAGHDQAIERAKRHDYDFA